ncbi:BcsE family c-di-GMP-binding protein [Pollutimonas subterranea]|uniref:BcsE family c-di-GMP-binding protein n=1 Tax=Pollutimonas subterranea TaxID=2045210 RepID=UPI0013043439|nr:BcsE family c-di-GMP-binding protein [Pollutimonas subterranea]
MAINDLPIELGQMRRGSLYWLGATHEADAYSLIQQILANASPSSKVALIAASDPSGLWSELKSDEGPQDARSYRLTGNPTRALEVLTKDLDRILNPRGRTLIVVLADNSFAALLSRVAHIFAQWQRWLANRECTLLMVVHGAHVIKLSANLTAMNDILSGFALLEQCEAVYRYRVMHWRNTLDSLGSTELELTKSIDGFSVVQARPERSVTTLDSGRFLMEAQVLEGMALFMADDWHVFASQSDLFMQAMHATAATVVLAMSSSSEVPALARMLHSLRRQRGPALKLVIREMQRTLRYRDEQVLRDCGATLIIPAGTPLPQFFSLLESIQGQTFSRALAADPVPLIASLNPLRIRGILGATQFLGALDTVRPRHKVSVVTGVLIVLTPVPGLSAAQAMSQLDLRRAGDIACQLEGVLYVFLFDCRPNMTQVALRNIFHLHYSEMFTDHRICITADEIDAEITAMRSRLGRVRAGTATLDDSDLKASVPLTFTSLRSAGMLRPIRASLPFLSKSSS